MKRAPFWFRAMAIALPMQLLGCAASNQTDSEVTYRQPGDRFLGAPQPAQPQARADLEYAWLSEAAYGNTTAGLEEKDARTAAAVTDPAIADDCPVPQAALFARNWKVWPGFPGDGMLTQIEKYHLRVEVWTRQSPPEVAVAFGGTVFNNRNDWISNLRWFLPSWLLGGHIDEYSELVQTFSPAFAAEYKARMESGEPDWAFLKTATVYATGHSLGGGLAQQFAYALPLDAPTRVTRVVVFDPSPVTGYFSVPESLRDQNKQTLSIDRAYERGEILALARSLTSVVIPPSASAPSIRGIRYALFYPAAPIAGHSIHELACKLNEAAQ